MRDIVKIGLFLMLPLFAGCSVGEEEYPDVSPYDPEVYITVKTSVAEVADTRGTLVSSEAEMTDFGFFCTYSAGNDWREDMPIEKMFNRKMVKSGDPQGRYTYWAYDGGDPVTWNTGPGTTADDRYTFFAYAPYASAANGITVIDPAQVQSVLNKPNGRPFISYKVPAANADQPDLMIATRRENIRPTGNPVSMQMNHALTALGFRIDGQGQRISTITISDIYDTGIAELSGGSIVWNHSRIDGSTLVSAARTTIDLTATLTYDAATGDYTTSAGGYLMMVPQALTPDTKITMNFSDGTPSMTYRPSQEWRPGDRLTYNILLGPDLETPTGGGGW